MKDKEQRALPRDNPGLKLGVWDWDLSKDLIYADESVAKMFGLDAALAEGGLAPHHYFARIHDEDRQTIVEHARICVDTLGMCLDDFRIVRPNGTILVHSRGRCFADSERKPTIYAGLIVEIDQPPAETSAEVFNLLKHGATDDILYLCLHARRISSNFKRPLLQYLLDMVIFEIKDANSQGIDGLKYLI